MKKVIIHFKSGEVIEYDNVQDAHLYQGEPYLLVIHQGNMDHFVRLPEVINWTVETPDE